MATRPFLRNTVSVYHRSNDAPDIPGDQRVRAAFEARDVEALRCALAEYPGAWRTDLIRMSAKGQGRNPDGPCAHFAAEMGWSAALAVLHDAGDPLNERHPTSGFTPLQRAVRSGRVACVRKLLRLGVSTGEKEKAPALAGLCGVDLKVRVQHEIADVLLQAGADPWSMVPLDRRQAPLPIALLQWENIALATHVAMHGTAPAIEDDNLVLSSWMKGLKRSTAQQNMALLDALHAQGLAPTLSALAGRMASASRDASVYNPNRETEEQILAQVLARRFELGVCLDDARVAAATLHGHPAVPGLLALLEQRVLDGDTPRQTSPRMQRRL